MAVELIIEDGTGDNPLANSYADASQFKQYLKDRSVSFDFSTSAINAALIDATYFIDAKWGLRFGGYLMKSEQPLLLPRNSLYDKFGRLQAGIPDGIVKATILYAKASLEGSLYAANSGNDPKEVKKKKVVIGPITTELEYEGIRPANGDLAFPEADEACSIYATKSSAKGRVVRY